VTFTQRRISGWLILAVFALAGSAWLWQLDFAQKVSTDVLDLIPVDQRDPELAIVRGMASDAEARTMLIVLRDPTGSPVGLEAARRFVQELERSRSFTQVVALGDPAWRDAAAKALFDLRFALLLPGWLEGQDQRDLPQTVARRLKEFLETPEAFAFQDLIPADPLLLLPDALKRMGKGLTLVGPDPSAGSGLVWAQLRESPLSEAGQRPAFAAIEAAAAATRAEFPGIVPSYTGVNRFAAASRDRIEREVSWLNLFSLVAVLAVAWTFVRGVHRALHLVPVVLLAVLGAWVVTTLTFDRVHVIVFALGALLTGVAIDYGFYLYMQPPASPDEDYGTKVRRLMKPLLASCFTTVTGFALLLLAELPMIRQLGVFVGAGLLCALGAAVVYFATVREPFLEARVFRWRGGLSPVRRRQLRRVLVVLWVLALPGLARLSWRDDIRQLEVPAPEVQAEDAKIRAVFGRQGDATVYLSRGATLDEARMAVHTLEKWLGTRAATWANLAPVIPTAEARAGALRFVREHPEFPRELRTALAAEGFTAEEFEPFFNAYTRYAAEAASGDFDRHVDQLRSKLTGPIGLLLHAGAGQNWLVTLATGNLAEPPPAEAQTVTASQLQTLNRLFSRYRESALQLSLLGLAVVGAGVLLTYGVRDGLRIFAIPCGACLGIFGALGWAGVPLNLFHLLGAFLGVCLTHNYSIFSATSAYRHEPPPVSVRLSALTTAASFGVLATSGIPVVRALGLTVALMVLAALLVIELEHLSSLGQTRPEAAGNKPQGALA
jgi:predicted exporter